MKITFVNTRYIPNEFGGAERTVRALAEALVRRGHDVSAISLAHGTEAPVGEINGVRTYHVPLANVFLPRNEYRQYGMARRALWHVIDSYNPVMGHRLGRILDQERPDVVQTSSLQGFSVAAWCAARQRQIPVVQMLHDYYLGCPNSAMFRHGKNCLRRCISCRVLTVPRIMLSNIPAAVISVSAYTLARLSDCGLFANVPIKRVIHGISDPSMTPIPRHRVAGRGSLTLGYLGRMEPTKGIEVLLEAATRARDVEIRVILAGSGHESYISSLKQRYSEGRIEYVGYTSPEELFRRIDFLVVPSVWHEPLGRVIYEAYAFGVPVIVARAGGMPEIVEEGSTGFVVSPGDPSELAGLLRRLSFGWENQYFDACVAKSREFSADQRFNEYYDVWRRAAARTS